MSWQVLLRTQRSQMSSVKLFGQRKQQYWRPGNQLVTNRCVLNEQCTIQFNPETVTGNFNIFSRKCKINLKRDEGTLVDHRDVRYCTLISFFFYGGLSPLGQTSYWMLEYSHETCTYWNTDLISRCESICKNHVFVLQATLITEDRHLEHPIG